MSFPELYEEKVYRSSSQNRAEIGRGDVLLGGTVFEFERTGIRRGLGSRFARTIHRSRGPGHFGAFIQVHNAGIGYFPTEGLDTALLLVTFFQKDGLSGVGRKITYRGQDDVSCAVSHFNAASKQT